MKILVVTPHYYPENFSITQLCEGLAKRGHDLLVVTDQPNYGLGKIKEGYEKVKDEVINGVRVHRCKTHPRKESTLSLVRNYLSFYRHAKRYCTKLREEFDVVYSMTLSPVISVVGANVYAKKHHVRHVLHCLDLWPESVVVTGAMKEGSLGYKILYRWSKKIYGKADDILISSPSFEAYFHDVLKIKDKPISYLPPPAFVGEEKDGDIASFSHKVNLVYSGNFGTLQLVENLVEAVSLVKDKADIALHLIGSGSRKREVEEKIASLQLDDCVFLYGTKPIDYTASFYEKGTAILVPLKEGGSVGKTIPSKLISALYYGKPILACISGDGREVLQEAGGSLFSQSEDPKDLAEAMLKMASLPEDELRMMGENNKKYFADNFELDQIIDRLMKHLEGNLHK